MAAGLNLISQTVGEENVVIGSGVLVAGILVVLSLIANRSLKSAKNPVVPDDRLTTRNFFELIAVFVLNLSDNVMGKQNRKYTPFVATLFIFILFSNLIGLVPGLSGPTGYGIPEGLLFNLGMALTVFVLYNYWGIREVGFKGHLTHFFGGSEFVKFPMILVGLMIFAIELISHCIRPLSLSLRLFVNMAGDHLVLAVFTDLTKLIIPVIFYGLGTFVSFMQAFVFALLAMIYIGAAVAHEEHH